MTDVTDMDTEQAIEVARRLRGAEATEGDRAAVVLAGDVIAWRAAHIDAVSTWRAHRAAALVPAEVRRALDALLEQNLG